MFDPQENLKEARTDGIPLPHELCHSQKTRESDGAYRRPLHCGNHRSYLRSNGHRIHRERGRGSLT